MSKLAVVALSVVGALTGSSAFATVAVSYGSQSGGLASWDSTVVSAGGSATSDLLSPGSSGARAAYTITRTGSATPVTIGGIYSTSGYSVTPALTTGGTIDISPAGAAPGHGSNPIDSISSGITFHFSSGVNGIGFEVGDWSTCCQVSNLYISFGAGAPIQVGSSAGPHDQFLTLNGPLVFVGAFDDSATFNDVHFWGDGYGEYLVAGGTIHFTTLQTGSIQVPEPASIALIGLGLGCISVFKRRKYR